MTIFETDRYLLAQFKIGETAALEKVYYHYVDKVDTIIRMGFYEKKSDTHIPGISNIDTQRELIHEVFSKAFKQSALDAFDGIRPYKSYLVTIVRNTIIDHYRRQNRDPLTQRHETLAEDQVIDVDSLHASAGAKTDNADELHMERCLIACETYLKQLDGREKEVVERRYRQGLKQEDVAKQLGISRWKVRSAEKRIEDGLRRFLKKEGLL